MISHHYSSRVFSPLPLRVPLRFKRTPTREEMRKHFLPVEAERALDIWESGLRQLRHYPSPVIAMCHMENEGVVLSLLNLGFYVPTDCLERLDEE